MTRRFKVRLGLATAAVLAVSASMAVAFTAPMVLYKPPVVKMFDIETNDSVENMVVGQDGNFLLFSSTPAQVAMHPNSDPGCEIDIAVACPKQGIKKIVMNLGAMNDSGEFDLNSNTADKIKQIAKGGADNDDLKGRNGAQVLKGGEGNDELEGGPGRDILIGGPGIDFCDGGPGNDTIKECEPPPERTFQPNILYKPPLIRATDIPTHNSVENMTIRRDGQSFTFENEISPPMINPASDPGCESKAGTVACLRAGVEKISVKLGDMDDAADIRLGKSSGSVKQKMDGQAGEDDLEGWKGKQKLIGGEGDDTLAGNKGPDILIGGEGMDICAGGDGEDIILECEVTSRR